MDAKAAATPASARRSVADRNKLVEGNLGLAYFVVDGIAGRVFCVDRDDLLAEAFTALILAAEHFDENRGFKFSTYAVKCIRTRLAKTVAKAIASSGRCVGDIEEDFVAAAVRPAVGNEAAWALSMLSPRESDVLARRFGLGIYPRSQTLDEVGSSLGGICRERVHQLELRAMNKVRTLTNRRRAVSILRRVG